MEHILLFQQSLNLSTLNPSSLGTFAISGRADVSNKSAITDAVTCPSTNSSHLAPKYHSYTNVLPLRDGQPSSPWNILLFVEALTCLLTSNSKTLVHWPFHCHPSPNFSSFSFPICRSSSLNRRPYEQMGRWMGVHLLLLLLYRLIQLLVSCSAWSSP